MKRFLAILLALAMIFALAACGGDNGSGNDGGSKKEEKKGLEDKWVWELTAEGLEMVINLEFDDGEFTMEIDEEKFKDSMIDALVEQGLSKEDAESYLELMDMDELVGEMESSGTYTTEDDTLTMTNEDGDKEVYTYELDGDELKMYPADDETEEAMEDLGIDCMELKRAS